MTLTAAKLIEHKETIFTINKLLSHYTHRCSGEVRTSLFSEEYMAHFNLFKGDSVAQALAETTLKMAEDIGLIDEDFLSEIKKERDSEKKFEALISGLEANVSERVRDIEIVNFRESLNKYLKKGTNPSEELAGLKDFDKSIPPLDRVTVTAIKEAIRLDLITTYQLHETGLCTETKIEPYKDKYTNLQKLGTLKYIFGCAHNATALIGADEDAIAVMKMLSEQVKPAQVLFIPGKN